MELPGRLLFVGAHCDDVELFAGGLLARACREGREVGILAFSDHRGVLSDAEADRARAEHRANVASLAEGASVTDHSALWLPACHGAFEAERGAIYAALEALRDRYDLVVTHASTDTNQDHRQVALEARRVFKMRRTALAGEFPANDVGEFRARVHVALEREDIDRKVALIGRYASQRLPGRPYLDEGVVRGLARVRGAQIGVDHAEAFDVLTRVVVR